MTLKGEWPSWVVQTPRGVREVSRASRMKESLEGTNGKSTVLQFGQISEPFVGEGPHLGCADLQITAQMSLNKIYK